MISLGTAVTVPLHGLTGTVVNCCRAFGRTSYGIRLADQRVLSFQSEYVRLAVQPVVRMPGRLRLVVSDGVMV